MSNEETVFVPLADAYALDATPEEIESVEDGEPEPHETVRNAAIPADPETFRFEGTSEHKWSGTSGCSAYVNSGAEQALDAFAKQQIAAHPELEWWEYNYTGGSYHITKKRKTSGKRVCYGSVTVNCYIIFSKKLV